MAKHRDDPAPMPAETPADRPERKPHDGPLEPGKLYVFAVSVGDVEPSDVIAPNPDEAWAMWCDRRKSWPNNTGRKVVCYGEAKE